MQQVASVSTREATLRSAIDGWTFEDARLLVKRAEASAPNKIFIGYTPSPKGIPLYSCVLEMLADGWELLGPPQREEWPASDMPASDGQPIVLWSWWLQRKRQIRVPA